jgi:hypothetical protein
MGGDAGCYERLPEWPDEAREPPEGESDRGITTDCHNREGWLIAAGLAYPAVAFGVLLGSGGTMGPPAFDPLLIPLPATALAAAAVGLWLDGVRFRWWALALFIGWLAVVVYAQWLVYAEAAAAV